MDALIRHYDQLVMEGNDPFRDPPVLRAYMDRWDGEPFLELLALAPDVSALEIGVGTGRLAGCAAPVRAAGRDRLLAAHHPAGSGEPARSGAPGVALRRFHDLAL